MRVWLSGAEVPAHRELLGRMSVDRVAFNLSPVVKQRAGKAGEPEGLEPFSVLFYSSQADIDDVAADDVLRAYAADDSAFYGLSTPFVSHSDRMIIEWQGGDPEEAIETAVENGVVGLSEGACRDPRVGRALTLFARRNPSVKIFTTSSKAEIFQLPFISDVIVSGWVHASQYRELQVWDGRKVVRVSKAKRAEGVEKYHAQIVNLGCDIELIREGDVAENTRLAIASWLQYEQVVATAPVTYLPGVHDISDEAPATGAVELVHREQVTLPVMRRDSETAVATGVAAQSFMQCDVCRLNVVCPKYAAGSACGFEIPVEIRTKDQLQGFMSTLLEIQGRRVMMATFSEEVLSQGIDGTTSVELTRMLDMVERIKRINEDRETVSIVATSSGGGGGALSQIFGQRVGQVNRELAAPISPEAVIDEAQIVEEEP